MPDDRGKFSLDELLRAKRRERPGPEFWASFDRELKSRQRQLIQKQLVRETRLKSPAARLYKLGAYSAAWGAAAIAVYFGFKAPIGESPSAGQPDFARSSAQHAPAPQPSFQVADTRPALATRPQSQANGLSEFATLAQTARPRVIIEETPVIAKAPTPSQLSALETIAELEQQIQAKRGSADPAPPYQFVSSSGLFESEAAMASADDADLEGYWDFEAAYLLGKYADPFTGTLDSLNASNRSISEIQNVSFSKIEDVISSQSSRRSKSLDALTVRF